MARADLQAAHSRLLGPAGQRFESDDLDDHLAEAAALMNQKRPRIVAASLILAGHQTQYSAPSDCWAPLALDWGAERRGLMPWQPGYLGPIPALGQSGLSLILTPAPLPVQINALGSEAAYRYFARHVIGDAAEDTTLAEADRPLLLLAALIAAMRQLSTINTADPITLHRGVGALPSNSTPAAHYEALLREWERRQ